MAKINTSTNTSLSTEDYNEALIKWGKQSRNKLKRDLNSLTRTEKFKLLQKAGKSTKQTPATDNNRKSLYSSIRLRTKKEFGEINKISFPFMRHGIFLQYGVSRGHSKNNRRKKINWLQILYEDQTPELNQLADLIASYQADLTMKMLK